MKRWLVNFAAALSLLLLSAITVAWALSHSRPSGWRLIGSAHSADLTRVNGVRGSVRFTTSGGGTNDSHPGFWDAAWSLSRAGQLTLLTQAIDYEGTLRELIALPPSLVLHLPGDAGVRAVVFGRMPSSGPGTNWLGFALHSDSQRVDGVSGSVSARAWMVTLPYWFILLLGVPIPLLWLRLPSRRGDARVESPGRAAGSAA